MKNLLLLAITLFVSLNIMAQSNTIQTVDLYSKNDVVYSIDISELDSINFVRSNSVIQTTTKPTHEGYEYVDMGLSVKWATCNVGGSKPGDSGDAFAWGETEPKEIYTSENFVGLNNVTQLPLSHDAANVNWGGNWRMPTHEEFVELYSNSIVFPSIKKNSNNIDVLGLVFYSKVNGNTLFFPYTFTKVKSNYHVVNNNYWTSTGTLQPSYGTDKTSFEIYYMVLEFINVTWGTSFAGYDNPSGYYGYYIRPVLP